MSENGIKDVHLASKNKLDRGNVSLLLHPAFHFVTITFNFRFFYMGKIVSFEYLKQYFNSYPRPSNQLTTKYHVIAKLSELGFLR